MHRPFTGSHAPINPPKPYFIFLHAAEVNFEPDRHSDVDYSIASGISFHPETPSIFSQNLSDGLIMDGTFTVSRLSHAAVLVARDHNMGLPLAVLFGLNESLEIHDVFSPIFKSTFDIPIASHIFESDQSTALKSVRQRHSLQ
jgi:hypothetical protein